VPSISLMSAGAALDALERRRANVDAVSAKPGVAGFECGFGGGVRGGVSGSSSRVRGSSSTVPGELSRLPRAKLS
jgi:hypothetical protein